MLGRSRARSSYRDTLANTSFASGSGRRSATDATSILVPAARWLAAQPPGPGVAALPAPCQFGELPTSQLHGCQPRDSR